MNLVFISLLLSYLSNYSDAGQEIKVYHKDYQYINTTQTYYKFHSPSTWTDAKQICDSECSSLWYPKNYNEVKTVLSVFKETNNFDSLYIGISDLDVEGTFETIDDIPIANVYNNWQVGQPDNFKNEDCVVIAPGRVLNDAPCSDKYNFICKKNESCAQELSKCAETHIDVKKGINVFEERYIDTIQARYKFHSPSTWKDAKKTCDSEGNSFWYPKNREEMRAILSLFKETQNFDWVYIGISDLDNEGTFDTIDGTPVENVYYDWDFDQPDDYQGEDCVHIAPNFLLNDVDCKREYSFICKETKKNLQKYNQTCDIGNSNLNKHVKDFYKDFEYMDETQAYYKFNSPSTWIDAKRKCDSDGSSLWYPKNYEEAHAVLSLFRETQNFNGLYIGISDIVIDGTFETIDGVPISNVYDNWREDQTNDVHGEKDCVHISPDAILNAIGCKETYRFVCKKTKRNMQEHNNGCDVSNLDATKDVEDVFKDYKYIEKTDAYYKYHDPSTWSDAVRKCESDGSSLWYPKNSDEAQAVLFRFGLTHNFGWLYVGISDIDVEGTFETIDGVPITKIYNTWKSDQPDNFKGAENCVHIASDRLLNDIDCWRIYPFVCKKTKSNKQACNKHDISKLGYKYNEDVDKWYKFHKNAMNWTGAYKVCSAEQSYLAVINSNIERNYLLGLIRGPDYYATQVIPKDTIHLGFHDRYGSGWQTIKGTKLDDSGYSRWAEGQPGWLTMGKEEKCGSMSYTGELWEVGCDTKSFFICEHDVDKYSY